MKFLAAATIVGLLSAVPACAQDAPTPKAEKGTMRLFKGQSFTGAVHVAKDERPMLLLEHTVGSIAVYPGEKWEVCDKPRFKGNCNIVDADMANMGTVAIQSARPVKP